MQTFEDPSMNSKYMLIYLIFKLLPEAHGNMLLQNEDRKVAFKVRLWGRLGCEIQIPQEVLFLLEPQAVSGETTKTVFAPIRTTVLHLRGVI